MKLQLLAVCHLFCGAIFLLTVVDTASAQSRIIQLEIASGERAEITTQQRWMEILSNVGADRVRSRTAFGAVEVKVEELEMGGATSIVVTGVIEGGKLVLPGGRFSIGDSQQIKAYIQKLRDDGSRVALADKKAFGLTSEQLVGLHEELCAVVAIPTKGVSSAKVVDHIIRLLKTRVVFDRTASRALSGDAPVHEELQGMSAGTALAAVIRPLGLVVQPYREQGKPLEIRMVDARSAEENWPIGWPIEKPVDQVEPRLLDNLTNIEIRDYPLKDILDRFEQRIGIPFIYDQNTMARRGVDLATTKVTLVKKKTAYMVAVTKLLAQTKPKMKQEVRVDENGKAFLWMTIPR